MAYQNDATGERPSFRVLEDGVHFEWIHDCRSQVSGTPFRDAVIMPHGGGSWRIQQLAPLTVTPSINCLACGTHGWIRDGEWVDA